VHALSGSIFSNQTMVRMFDCGRAISAHIEKKKSKCDYSFSRALTSEELSEIERRVNETIAADLPIGESFMERTEAQNDLISPTSGRSGREHPTDYDRRL